MFATQAATKKQRKQSRARNGHRPQGWQPSILSKRLYKRMEKDVAAGILPKSCLNVTMKIFGRKK